MHGRSGDTVARPQHSTRCCNSENIPGIQFWITIMKQMPSHVSHADNFLEAAHCVSQTGRMLLPSEYISGCWGCRWCSRCSQHQHRVPVGCQKSQHIELRISTGQNRLSSLILLHFEREILWTKPFIVIWTRWSIPFLPSMEDQTTFSQLLFCDHLFFLHHNELLQINVKK